MTCGDPELVKGFSHLAPSSPVVWPVRHGASYLKRAWAPEEDLVRDAKTTLAGVEFDTFVGTGLSGALVVPLLARAMGKHWAIVRKAEESRHSTHQIEGSVGHRWVFVDDQVDTGRTYRRVQVAMAIASAGDCRPYFLVGLYAYGFEGWGSAKYEAYTK